MGQSLIDFARNFSNPDKGRQSLSEYARALLDADPTQARTGAKIKASLDLSKPYGNVGDWDGLDPKTAAKVLELQQAWGEPLQLNSTFRSKSKNTRVGGAKRSQHLHGKAVDISVRGMSNKDRVRLLALASSLGFGGLGVYNNAIHVDTAGRRAWGPSYSRGSVPAWARSVISTHEKNGFKGQAAEFARGPIGDAGTDVAMDMPLPERKGTTQTAGRKIARGRNGFAAIKTTPGSAVTTPVSGTVVAYHPDFRSYRGTAIIKGEDGSYTMVTGLSAGSVKSGDQVKAGDVIGVAGNDVGIGQKGPDGQWSKDASALLGGVQQAGTQVAQGDVVSPMQGLLGGGIPAPSEATRPEAPSPLSGEQGMAGMQGMGRPSPAAQVARALSMPSMDASLMGGAPARAAPEAAPSYGIVSMNDPEVQSAFASQTADTPALDVDVTDGYGRPRSALANATAMSKSAAALGDIAAKQALVAGDLYGQETAPEMAPMTEAANMSALNAPSYGAKLGALPGMGSPPTALGLVSPIGDVTSADSYGFEANDPSMAIADVSPAAASLMGGQSQFAGIGAPDAMAYSGPSSQTSNTALGLGSFGGIGTPTADQAAAQRGMPSLSMAGLSGTPANSIVGPTQKADVYAPGLRDFKNAFEASVKGLGPNYSKAIAAALATPSLDNQLAAVEATRAYSNMNGKPSKAVTALRSQQIGDFAMANPALGNALGLSMGQGGQSAMGGGLGADPFGGRSIGGPSGPAGGAGGGFGGFGGQPSGPSISGPSGPSAGRGGGYGGGTSGGQPSGPSIGGPTGPAAGPGGGYGGGNPAGSPSPGGTVTGRGPSANPGSGGGLSASAAAAIGAALAGKAEADAAAAASSDAARGFGYGGLGPSFSGGFF